MKMKKDYMIFLGLTAFVMLWLPMLAFIVEKNDILAALLLLFYIVDPIYVVSVGCYAGLDIQKRWSMPLVVAVLFFIGVGFMISFKDAAFLVYAGVYAFLGYGAMIIANIIAQMIKKKKKK